jgi:hypothetical protein
MFTYGSKTVVNWVCKEKKHKYPCAISARTTYNNNCSGCSNKHATSDNCLAVQHPIISKEWDYEKNDNLTPNDVVPGSTREVFWKCNNGHSYSSVIRKRANYDYGCPICEHQQIDISTCFPIKNPNAFLFWDFDKNKDIDPFAIFPSSKIEVSWKCPEGHEWDTSISKAKNGCPICEKDYTKGECEVKRCLKNNNLPHKKDFRVKDVNGWYDFVVWKDWSKKEIDF